MREIDDLLHRDADGRDHESVPGLVGITGFVVAHFAAPTVRADGGDVVSVDPFAETIGMETRLPFCETVFRVVRIPPITSALEPPMTQATVPAECSEPQATQDFVDPRDFSTALGCFGTSVTVVTALAPDGRTVGLTANSFSSVSLNPSLVLWSLVMHSQSLMAFQDARHFARTLDDKFTGIDWSAGLGGAPLLDGAVAQFQCRNAFRYYGGDHVIFLGAVEAYWHGPGEPLLCSRGSFGSFMPGV